MPCSVIFETQGDALFPERAEKLAYNALPAALTKVAHPSRAIMLYVGVTILQDMWARVYLQQPNEV